MQIVRGQRHYAAFALHHFHQHGGRGRRDGRAQGLQVFGRNLSEAFRQGREAIAQAFAARGGQRAKGATVKAAAQSDDFIGVTLPDHAHVAPGQLDAGLVGLGAGIAEKCLAVVAGGEQQPGQIKLFLLVKEIAHMPELAALAFQGLADFVVAMAQTRHGNARQQIHIFLAVHIPEARALAPRNDQRVTAVRAAEQVFFLGFDGIEGVRHEMDSPCGMGLKTARISVPYDQSRPRRVRWRPVPALPARGGGHRVEKSTGPCARRA